MRPSAFVLALFLFCSLMQAQAISPGAVAALQAELRGQRLMPRDFSVQPSVACHQTDATLVCDTPPFRAFAFFTTEKVEVQKDELRISGFRSVIVRDATSHVFEPTTVHLLATLRVDLKGAEPSKVRDQLFFPDVSTALTAVPIYVSADVPAWFDAKTGSATGCGPCLGTQIRKDNVWQHIPPKDPNIRPPFRTKAGALNYESSSTRSLAKARDAFLVVVDESGHVAELWLLLPADADYDRAVANARQKDIFRPATYNGVPVASLIKVELSMERH